MTCHNSDTGPQNTMAETVRASWDPEEEPTQHCENAAAGMRKRKPCAQGHTAGGGGVNKDQVLPGQPQGHAAGKRQRGRGPGPPRPPQGHAAGGGGVDEDQVLPGLPQGHAAGKRRRGGGPGPPRPAPRSRGLQRVLQGQVGHGHP